MDKAEVIERVRKISAAPSVYEGLKVAADNWLKGVGTAEERALSKTLLAELEEDVQSLDDTLAFFESDEAKSIFGDALPQFLKLGEEAKAKGEKVCFCDACRNGQALLEHREALLG